jgi:hypothetical protein
MTNDAHRPDAATLAREASYICQPDGFTADRCLGFVSDADLRRIGWVRVEWKAVLITPRTCPINGEHSEPYYARLPHRPDGTRLTLR